MTNIHLIVGEDDFLVNESAKKVVGDGVGLEVIDSINSTNEELRLKDIREADASFSTPPFLEPKKTTWWRNVGFLPSAGAKGDAKVTEAVKLALEKFAARIASTPLPENQHFVISAPKLLMSSIFAKTLSPIAEVVTLTSGKPWEQARAAASRAMEFASEMKLAFGPGAAEAFVARVGSSSRSLMNEISKLDAYLGNARRTITIEDIDNLTSQGIGVEPEIWAVTDALGERDLSKALLATARFERENGFAVMMTTAVEKFFRELGVMKDASERGVFDECVKGKNPYAVKKLTSFLRNWSLRELRLARFRFLELRERAVSGSESIDILVLTEIVRTCKR